jgi:hypothetical protein
MYFEPLIRWMTKIWYERYTNLKLYPLFSPPHSFSLAHSLPFSCAPLFSSADILHGLLPLTSLARLLWVYHSWRTGTATLPSFSATARQPTPISLLFLKFFYAFLDPVSPDPFLCLASPTYVGSIGGWVCQQYRWGWNLVSSDLDPLSSSWRGGDGTTMDLGELASVERLCACSPTGLDS